MNKDKMKDKSKLGMVVTLLILAAAITTAMLVYPLQPLP